MPSINLKDPNSTYDQKIFFVPDIYIAEYNNSETHVGYQDTQTGIIEYDSWADKINPHETVRNGIRRALKETLGYTGQFFVDNYEEIDSIPDSHDNPTPRYKIKLILDPELNDNLQVFGKKVVIESQGTADKQTNSPAQGNYQAVFDQSCKMRDNFWDSIGQSEPDVITPIIPPSFMGGPRWPSLRQAYKVVHLSNRGTLLASDGLSDPYDDIDETPESSKYQGLGLEFYIKTYESLTTSDMASWQLKLLMNVSQLAASQANLADIFNEEKIVSTSLANPGGLPEIFVHPDGYVGALLGMIDDEVPSSIDMPLEKTSIINIKLLTAAELNYCMEHRKEGREYVQRLLEEQKEKTYSTLDRQSVI